MKKRLLLAAFALVGTLSSYAYEVGEYVYTSTQKFKITGENAVTNGDFSEGLVGWSGSDEGAVSTDAWTIDAGAGPNGENVLKSLGATAGVAVCQVAKNLAPGSYLASLQIKGADNRTAVGTTIAANYVGIFKNTDGALNQVASTDEAPVTGISTAQNFNADSWVTLAFLFDYADGDQVVLHLEQLSTDVMVTNIVIQPAIEVYDDRVVTATLNYYKALLEDENFNVEAAADAKANMLEGVIPVIEGMMEAGELDDISAAEEMMTQMAAEFETYLAVTSRRMNDKLAGTDNVASLAAVGRGGNRPATYANLDLQGGNWGHIANTDYLMSAIQNGYAHTATYTAFNKYFPAGKYFFSAEIRNANTGKVSWPCEPRFNLATDCQMFIGADTVAVDSVAGEDYRRIYMFADVAEAGAFRAGVYWPGTSSGGAFFIRNVEVRAFGDAQVIEDGIAHIQAWETYSTQWNAAVGARNNMVKLDNQPNYPWGQDSLRSAHATWDPYYSAQFNKHWLNDDGSDAGIATTEQFEDWALYQGVELYSEPDTLGNVTRKEYQVVRGYQNTYNYVVKLNKPFTDLATAIDNAKKTRNTGAYASGNRDAYKAAILEAIATIKDVRAKTIDDTRVADSTTLANAEAKLAEATAAFLASVSLPAFIDIDFSNLAKQDDETGTWTIEGAAGTMVLPNYAEPGTANNSFTQGVDATVLVDVLRVGNGAATVAIPEEYALGENDNLMVTFDVWIGSLLGKNFYFELRNVDNVRVAGFSVNRYNGTLAYNDFDTQLTAGGPGLNILGYATGSAGKNADANVCLDNNKSSFTLVVNYRKGTVQGTLTNPQKGTVEGAELPINAELTDNKITQLAVGSNYTTDGRRCWFDNLKAYKYADVEQEEDITENGWAPEAPITDGIATVKENSKFANTIYSISGVRMDSKNLQKGLYIINGRKVVIK